MRMSSPEPRRLWWLMLVPALFCVSCGGPSVKLNPVEGTVIYKGQPLEGATVSFHPQAPDKPNPTPSTGVTDAEGKFTLKTGDYDGAPAGDYVVTLIKSVQVGAAAGKKGMISTEPVDTTDALQGAYSNR